MWCLTSVLSVQEKSLQVWRSDVKQGSLRRLEAGFFARASSRRSRARMQGRKV